MSVRNLKLAWRAPMSTLLGLSLALGAMGCAEGSGSAEESLDSSALGKADVTVGPIEQIRCELDQSFTRRGGFVSVKVNARDSAGAQSRNYVLKPKPEVGARVVQRDQVIFDLEGSYSIQCCALDTALCDQVAVQVGEVAPALALSVAPFSVEQATLSGRALDRIGKPAQVTVNGAPAVVDTEGRFEHRSLVPTGLNRFEVVATDGEGVSSVRHAWTIGGPFNDIDAIDPGALRLQLSQSSYPMFSRLLTEYFVQLAEEYSSSEGLRVTQEGSALGYEYEVTPYSLSLGETSVILGAGRRADELSLVASIQQLAVSADGRTRFSGDWQDREVVVTANLEIIVYFSPHSDGVEINQVKSEVGDLNVEISDMPSFIEGILELIFESSIQKKLVEVVESVSDPGLNSILTRFEVSERLTLSPPLSGELALTGRVSELEVSDKGLLLGVGLAIDGETDPARVKAPGPLMTSFEVPALNQGAPYELAFHLDLLNRLFFSAWQTGGLDIITTMDQPLGEDHEHLGDQRLTLFATPSLPPTVRMGEREGELMIELGAMTVDGVLESQLAVLNFSLEVGGSLRALLSAHEEALFASAAVEELTADVLIAPAGWEKEPTRQLIGRLIETEVAPKYVDLLRSLPVPSADLSGLNLTTVRSLTAYDLTLSSTPNSVTIGAALELK